MHKGKNILKSIIVFVVVLLCPLTLHAAEVASGKFSFHLNGEWSITKDGNGSITAVQQNKETTRAFILSVHTLTSREEIIDALLYLRNYLDNLPNENSALVKESDFTQYKTSGGAPFDYIAYTDKAQNGFFIGATLGSNSGVVLVTYEGSGNYKNGVRELKVILNNMKII